MSGAGPVRIAMWSGPRNLSTAMMRAWENRPDTVVLDEPLYAHYLTVTGLDHPVREKVIASQPTDPNGAIAACLAPLHSEKHISYQKHMSHHLLPGVDRSWLSEFTNMLLIRHPARVLASYVDKREDVTLDDLGLPQQIELLDRCELVIDTDDFTDPEWYLNAQCEAAGVEFSSAMLSWPAGPRDSDGVWASHWYDSVRRSTGFRLTGASGPEPLPSAPPGRELLLAEAIDVYVELARHRLVRP